MMIDSRVIEKIFTGSISYTNSIIRELVSRGYYFIRVREHHDGKRTYVYGKEIKNAA